MVNPTRSGLSRLTVLIATLAILATGLMPTRAVAAEAEVYVVPDAVDATGSRDVTDELLAYFAGVPDGSVISFPDDARYRIEGTLLLENRNDLTFEGNGATFFATTEADRTRRHWRFLGGSNISVQDVTVRGSNPHAGTSDLAYSADREAQHGFDFGGVKGVTLDRVSVFDVWGDFVYLGRHGKGVVEAGWTSDVMIRNSHFERNGRQGIAITGAHDVTIENNYIGHTRRATIDIEPNGPSWGARRIHIDNNDIGPGRLLFVAGHGHAGPVSDINITRNRLHGKTFNISLKAPSATRRERVNTSDNDTDKAFGSPNAGITIEGFDGVTVKNNRLLFTPTRNMLAVRTITSCDITIANNTFTGAIKDHTTDNHPCTVAAEAEVYVVPDAVDATGSRDVTDELLAYFAGVPDGSVISFPDDARYRIEGTLLLENRNDLTFEGNGATFFATTEADRTRRHWRFLGGSNISVQDVTVRGSNPHAGTSDLAYSADREAQHGFDFGGVKGVTLDRVSVFDVWGDFVYLGRHGKGVVEAGWTSDVMIRNSHFERNGRQGIAITGAHDVTIENNYIGHTRRATIDIEPNGPSWGARRIHIDNNDIGPGRLLFVAGHGHAGPVSDINITRNRLHGKTFNISLKAPSATRRERVTISDNDTDKAFGSPNAGITIEGFDGVTVKNNRLLFTPTRNMLAVRTITSCDITIANNTFTGAIKDHTTDNHPCTVAPRS